ncbi:MAG TPA: hypothetical protein VLD37_00630 [Candidatus Bilamarchaeum sp.]|nr:hypothetical protein [Candidatus Bilamarchaeum sp.]
MTDQKHMYFGVSAQSLHKEINRLRKRDGLEEVGGLGFALKLHDHVLVEPNPRIIEAVKNLKAPPDRIPAEE